MPRASYLAWLRFFVGIADLLCGPECVASEVGALYCERAEAFFSARDLKYVL
jgi:hypothetical protein